MKRSVGMELIYLTLLDGPAVLARHKEARRRRTVSVAIVIRRWPDTKRIYMCIISVT